MAQPRNPALEALVLLAAGDWDGAHALVQDENSAEAAWVHGHLHRVDGDVENARYWYAKAEKPVAAGDLETERRAIETALKCAAD
jgi:hypothetical protein